MRAEELQLGDIITYLDGTICKVREIREDTISVSWIDKDSKDWYTSPMSATLFNPIELTPEILEKNGFVKYNEVSDTPPYDQDEEGNMYYSYKGEQKFWGWWQPTNVYLIPVNAMIDLEIKFVHELQHALRLCGINKEIEL